ncbi:MAG TPA: YdeI/OmpD-associated family protein [Thermoanaerobaculia bacterium]|nr:YdeI/OmpD-associated family protein [Thermoanaerobaculia bacterium]
MNAQHFVSQQAFRKWLEKNHDKVTELFVRFYRKDTGRGGMTYKESVDEALCFGWIDGVRKRLDEESYAQRFTPRKKKSYWSAVNTKRFEELHALGLVAPSGQAAFDARDASATQRYSFEREQAEVFSPELEAKFRAKKKAWKFFEKQPPGYRRLLTFYVMSAKQEETRVTRLEKLIEASAAGKRL